MKTNISIDVSLLAIVLAMYLTKQDNRMILILVTVLISHVLMTSDYEDDHRDSHNIMILGAKNDEPGEESEIDQEITENVETIIDPAMSETSPVMNDTGLTPVEQFKTTVSSGVFERNISTPQTQFTSSIFPKTSLEANGKIADSRGSFFKSLVS